MKHYISTLVFVSCLLCAAVNLHARAVQEERRITGEKADISYAFGMLIGSDFSSAGLDMDYTAFTEGFRDIIEGSEQRFTPEEAVEIAQAAFQAAQAKKNEENRITESLFLAGNGARPEVQTTASGLQYEVLAEAEGAKPAESDTVRVNYEGAFTDGSVFDSSFERGEPVEFPLDGVIPGWTEGIQLMSTGSKYRFYIPSALAYGEQGAGQTIPPYSTLVFTVELLDIIAPELETGEIPK